MTSLVKYDGRRDTSRERARVPPDAGRAGRAGFDTVGFRARPVPEHEVELRERARLSAAQEAARDAREVKRARKKSAKKRKDRR